MKISYIIPITASQGSRLIATQAGLHYLKDSLNSVLRQSIPHWELVVISQRQYQRQVAALLNECIESLPSDLQSYAKKNVFLQTVTSKNPAKACNEGLALSKGKFVAIIQLGDKIAEHATYEIIKAKVTFKKLQFAYPDQDYLNHFGDRFNPFHKPDLSPDFLYCQNYIGSFGIFDRSMLKKLGGWREQYQYAYDYELNLRVIEHLKNTNQSKRVRPDNAKIAHLQAVLYHQRTRKNNRRSEHINIRPTQGIEKIQGDEGLRVIAKHLKGINKAVKVEQIRPKLYRHFWPIPKPEPLVTLIIPTRDGYGILKACVDSILQKTTYKNYEILIVNNQSQDQQTLNYLKELPRNYHNIRVLSYNKSFNYSALNNYAASKAKGSILGFINNDTEVITPDWLNIMVSHAARSEIGAVGTILYYPDGSIQHAGIKVENKLIENDHQGEIKKTIDLHKFNLLESIRNPIGVTAAALLIQKTLFHQVGGFNAKKFRIEYNDVDLCLKLIETNKYNIWLPHVELFHHESKTRNKLKSYDKNDYINIQKRIDINPFIKQKELTQNLKIRPLISVVMPTFNTKTTYLREAIESVINQTYPKWELCIADDASTNPETTRLLKQYSLQDKRIKIVYRKYNGHISLASNSAIKIAKGKYIALLDHDDALTNDALLEVVNSINRNPDAKLIYSDEDKISADGKFYFEPHYKSDWNPDLFYSNNYIAHLCIVNSDLIKKIGGFRKNVEGSQDYDLILRCLPHIKPDQIIHIRKILYHWRASADSTASNPNVKNYTTRAGLKALQDYFKSIKESGIKVETTTTPNIYRARWPLPINPPKVSLIIPTRDALEITKKAVYSILNKTTYSNYEIIIVDNDSKNVSTLKWFECIKEQDARVKILRYSGDFNYSAINNFAAKESQGEILGLVNNDTEIITPEWLSEMVSHAIRPDIGCVGAKLYYPNDTVQHGGIILGMGGVAGHFHKDFPRGHPGYFGRLITTQNLSAVTAACLVVKKRIYEEVGGLNEQDLKVAFNDVDVCLKVHEKGYRNLWTPYAEIYHHESFSRRKILGSKAEFQFNEEVNFMQTKWFTNILVDKYFSAQKNL